MCAVCAVCAVKSERVRGGAACGCEQSSVCSERGREGWATASAMRGEAACGCVYEPFRERRPGKTSFAAKKPPSHCQPQARPVKYRPHRTAPPEGRGEELAVRLCSLWLAYLEDLVAAERVRQLHHNLAVEAARAHESRVQNIRAVGGGDHHNGVLARLAEPVQLRQHLSIRTRGPKKSRISVYEITNL